LPLLGLFLPAEALDTGHFSRRVWPVQVCVSCLVEESRESSKQASKHAHAALRRTQKRVHGRSGGSGGSGEEEGCA
jgi:hypothetical protein